MYVGRARHRAGARRARPHPARSPPGPCAPCAFPTRAVRTLRLPHPGRAHPNLARLAGIGGQPSRFWVRTSRGSPSKGRHYPQIACAPSALRAERQRWRDGSDCRLGCVGRCRPPRGALGIGRVQASTCRERCRRHGASPPPWCLCTTRCHARGDSGPHFSRAGCVSICVCCAGVQDARATRTSARLGTERPFALAAWRAANALCSHPPCAILRAR